MYTDIVWTEILGLIQEAKAERMKRLYDNLVANTIFPITDEKYLLQDEKQNAMVAEHFLDGLRKLEEVTERAELLVRSVYDPNFKPDTTLK